jgi:hypothetical protein
MIGEYSQQTWPRQPPRTNQEPDTCHVAAPRHLRPLLAVTWVAEYIHVAPRGPMALILGNTWTCHISRWPLSEWPPLAAFRRWQAVAGGGRWWSAVGFCRKMAYSANRGRRIADNGLF